MRNSLGLAFVIIALLAPAFVTRADVAVNGGNGNVTVQPDTPVADYYTITFGAAASGACTIICDTNGDGAQIAKIICNNNSTTITLTMSDIEVLEECEINGSGQVVFATLGATERLGIN